MSLKLVHPIVAFLQAEQYLFPHSVAVLGWRSLIMKSSVVAVAVDMVLGTAPPREERALAAPQRSH
ncbi:hypothetical protein [Rhodovulum sulfidophilum]|uniref:hypothetical protein n=1 Tax=Rhodovulum sulfidophilum TaxID=35806 RepID=UPI001922303C|nr:hypothetical protein [Rhodovulum sulfidophilum]MBL3559455.1 hypothetical protein [Rhodovulum sulfidophilum]